MAAHSVVMDSIQTRPEHVWGDWAQINGGYMRRRRRIHGLNDHWGNWSWDPNWNQHFRLNPVANGTQVETTDDEFEFIWRTDELDTVTSRYQPSGGRPESDVAHERDTEQPRAAEESGNDFEQDTVEARPDRKACQGSTSIHESDGNIVSRPADLNQQAANPERSALETEHDGGGYEESTVVASDQEPVQSNVVSHQVDMEQQAVIADSEARRPSTIAHLGKLATKSVSSAISSGMSASAFISGRSAASVAPSLGEAAHKVTATAASETSNAVAAWIFGTATLGVAGVTAHATRKTADASMRSARAGEVNARASTRSAMAAEESARAGARSALAAEQGVAFMHKQFEVMNLHQREPPVSNDGGIDTGFVEVRSLTEEISQEQKRTREALTATSAPSAASLTSRPMRDPQWEASKEPKGGADSAQTPRWIQTQTSRSEESSVGGSSSKQIPGGGINTMRSLQLVVRQKESQLQNLMAFQESHRSRIEAQELDEKRNRMLTRRLQDLRNQYA
ncbi:hypothetical protein ACJ41O_015325 [Fusarium nematophilum]